jgi:cell division protein FtsL
VSAEIAGKSKKIKTEKRKSLFVLTEAQAVLTWGVILALAAMVGGIYLFQTSSIATVGRQVQVLRNDLDEVKRFNSELERDIAEAQSLDRLQEEALRLGYIRAQPEDVEYMVIPNYPVHVAVSVAESRDARPERPETIGEALWLYIQSSVGGLMRGESR